MGRPGKDWSGFVSRNGVKVINYIGEKRWNCQCPICGNIFQKSTKHINDDMVACFDCFIHMRDDIAGQKFNMLTAVRFDHIDNCHNQFWLFKCDCGCEKVIRRDHVVHGRTKSCGCSMRDDITGQKFHMLTAINYDHSDDRGRTYWNFRCDCGCEHVILKNSVLSGNTQSCGCIKSFMEAQIKKMLTDNGVKYEEQKSFDDCCDKSPLYFDFYVPDLNLLIEAQGEQHYRPIDHFGGQERFEDQQYKDQIKRDWCSDNGINLLEIRYDADLESIIEKEVLLPARMMLNIGGDTIGYSSL